MIPSTPMKRDSGQARIAFSDTITNEKANASCPASAIDWTTTSPLSQWTASSTWDPGRSRRRSSRR